MGKDYKPSCAEEISTFTDWISRRYFPRIIVFHSPFGTELFSRYKKAVLGRGLNARQAVSHLGPAHGAQTRDPRGKSHPHWEAGRQELGPDSICRCRGLREHFLLCSRQNKLGQSRPTI